MRILLGALGLLPWWLWLAVIGGALACTHIAAWRAGADGVRVDWQAAELKRQQVENDTRREDGRIARAADDAFQAWLADQPARQAEVTRGLRQALSGPSRPAATVAAVVVPRAAVDRLRDAGADGGPPGPAASEPRR